MFNPVRDNSKLAKAYNALLSAGETGIHSHELNSIIHSDRAAARVNNLVEKGCIISSTYEPRNGCPGVRYRMTYSPFSPKQPEPTIAEPMKRFMFRGSELVEIIDPQQEALL